MTFLKCISFRCCSVCCCGRRRFCGVPGYVCWLGFGSNGSNSPSRLLAVVLLVLGSRLVDMANDLVFFRGGQPSPRLSPTQRSGRNRWLAYFGRPRAHVQRKGARVANRRGRLGRTLEFCLARLTWVPFRGGWGSECVSAPSCPFCSWDR